MAKLMLNVEAGNDLGINPSTPLLQVVSKLSRRDWNEIRLWHRKARRLHHHP
jgi:hypothetical protein